MRRAGASGAPALRVTPVRHGRRGADELTLTAQVVLLDLVTAGRTRLAAVTPGP
jgi:hypothetical protein